MGDYLPVKPWWMPRFVFRWMIFEIVKVLREIPLDVYHFSKTSHFDPNSDAGGWYRRVTDYLQKELEKK